MILNTHNKRLDIQELVLKKLDKIIYPKYRLFRNNKIYFEKEGGEISCISCADGYNIFFRKDGSRVFPRAVQNRELYEIVKCIERGDIYSWSIIGDQKCKVRPKRI
jgi:hypothetical protein